MALQIRDSGYIKKQLSFICILLANKDHTPTKTRNLQHYVVKYI